MADSGDGDTIRWRSVRCEQWTQTEAAARVSGVGRGEERKEKEGRKKEKKKKKERRRKRKIIFLLFDFFYPFLGQDVGTSY